MALLALVKTIQLMLIQIKTIQLSFIQVKTIPTSRQVNSALTIQFSEDFPMVLISSKTRLGCFNVTTKLFVVKLN